MQSNYTTLHDSDSYEEHQPPQQYGAAVTVSVGGGAEQVGAAETLQAYPQSYQNYTHSGNNNTAPPADYRFGETAQWNAEEGHSTGEQAWTKVKVAWRTFVAGFMGLDSALTGELDTDDHPDKSADALQREREILEYTDKRYTTKWSKRMRELANKENEHLHKFVDQNAAKEAEVLLNNFLFEHEEVQKLKLYGEDAEKKAIMLCKYAMIPGTSRRLHHNVIIALTNRRLIVVGADHNAFFSRTLKNNVKDVESIAFDSIDDTLRKESVMIQVFYICVSVCFNRVSKIERIRTNSSVYFSLPLHSVRDAVMDFSTASLSAASAEIFLRYRMSGLVLLVGLVLIIFGAIFNNVLAIIVGCVYLLLGIVWLAVVLFVKPKPIRKTEELDTVFFFFFFFWFFGVTFFELTRCGRQSRSSPSSTPTDASITPTGPLPSAAAPWFRWR